MNQGGAQLLGSVMKLPPCGLPRSLGPERSARAVGGLRLPCARGARLLERQSPVGGEVDVDDALGGILLNGLLRDAARARARRRRRRRPDLVIARLRLGLRRDGQLRARARAVAGVDHGRLLDVLLEVGGERPRAAAEGLARLGLAAGARPEERRQHVARSRKAAVVRGLALVPVAVEHHFLPEHRVLGRARVPRAPPRPRVAELAQGVGGQGLGAAQGNVVVPAGGSSHLVEDGHVVVADLGRNVGPLAQGALQLGDLLLDQSGVLLLDLLDRGWSDVLRLPGVVVLLDRCWLHYRCWLLDLSLLIGRQGQTRQKPQHGRRSRGTAGP
mmetsp:Transcript_44357/g.117267  ORF Transcript_44357/g.117267 Transcript_44357/m.117267 type:complete len:329 (-) Transcript_44357:6-992(-)